MIKERIKTEARVLMAVVEGARIVVKLGTILGFGTEIRNYVIPPLWSGIENNMLTKPICDGFFQSTTALINILPISDSSKFYGAQLATSLAPIMVGLCVSGVALNICSNKEKTSVKIYNAAISLSHYYAAVVGGSIYPRIGSIASSYAIDKFNSWAYKKFFEQSNSEQTR